MNGQELAAKHGLEQLQIRKEGVQLRIKKAVTARELFANMAPLAEFDDTLIPKLVERIDVVDKITIRVVFLMAWRRIPIIGLLTLICHVQAHGMDGTQITKLAFL